MEKYLRNAISQNRISRKHLKHGKPFYATIVFCVLFLLIITSVCLFISLRTLDILGEQARISTAAALKSNMAYLSASRKETSLDELGSQLNHDGLLSKMSDPQMRDAVSISQMEERLYALYCELSSDTTVPYLYFSNGGYAMGYEAAGSDVRGVIESFVFEDVASLPLNLSEYSETRLMHTQSGGQLSVRTKLVAQNIYLLYVSYGDPIVTISSDLLSSLNNPEMYYYDRLGNVGACQPTRTLMNLYNYHTLGNAYSGSFSFEYQGKTYNCYYDQVADSETRFALFAEDSAAQAKQTLMKSIFLIVGLILVCGIVFALLFARKLYRPMQDLVKELPYEKNSGIRDDFRLLRDAIESKDDAIASQREMLTRITLLRLMQETHADFHDALAANFFFQAQDAFFAVAALRTDSAPAQGLGMLSETFVEHFFTSREIPTLCVKDGQLLICVFDLRHKSFVDLTVCLEAIRDHTRSQDNVVLSAFVSSAHAMGGASLRQAYMEALQVTEFCAVLEKYDTVLAYDSVRKQLHAGYGSILDYGELQKLTCAVTSLCDKDALELFDRITRKVFLRKESSHAAITLCLPILRNALSLSIHEIEIPGDTFAEEVLNYSEKIKTSDNFQQLRDVLEETLAGLGALNAQFRSDSGRFNQAKAYVLEHYLEPYLSAGAVADELDTSQSNITRLFKKYNHTGFLEYVNMLRVEKAKTLLSTTQYSVSDISAMVGYSNTVTLTRAFKRYAGTTPGSFRQETGLYSQQ